jgi:hypothetical protein
MKSAFLIFALLFGQLGGIAWEFSVAAGSTPADDGKSAGPPGQTGVTPPDIDPYPGPKPPPAG